MAARILRYAVPAAMVAVYFYLTREIWPPILVAFLLAALLHPLILRLQAKGRSRAVAVGSVYLASLAILGLVLTFLAPAAVRQARTLAENLQSSFTSTSAAPFHKSVGFGTARIPVATVQVGRTSIQIPARLAARIPELSAKATVWITDWLKWLANAMLGMAPDLIWLVLIPILSFYFLLDYEQILARGLALIPASRRQSALTLGQEIGSVFSRYIRSLAMLCVLDSFLTCTILTLMGVKQAVALGLVAGVLYVVPYIGAILSTVLIGMTALITGSPNLALWVILVMVLLHQVFLDEIVAPRLLGGHVGLHPILSIVAMLSGEKLFGPTGMILAVPVAASIQIVLLRLYPHLAGKEPAPAASQGSELTDVSPGVAAEVSPEPARFEPQKREEPQLA